MHLKILSYQNTLTIYRIVLTDTIHICLQITHPLCPAQSRIFS